MNELNMS